MHTAVGSTVTACVQNNSKLPAPTWASCTQASRAPIISMCLGAGFNEDTSGCCCLCICSARLSFRVCLVMKSCSWVLFMNDSRNGILIARSLTSRVRWLHATNAKQRDQRRPCPTLPFTRPLFLQLNSLFSYLFHFLNHTKAEKSLWSSADQFGGVLLYWRFPQLKQTKWTRAS